MISCWCNWLSRWAYVRCITPRQRRAKPFPRAEICGEGLQGAAGKHSRRDRAPRSASGQTLVEFALILVFATIVVLFALSTIGPDIAEPMGNVANELNG